MIQVAPDAVFHALTTQKTELVLTAHPTEVNRRTYLNKHKKVGGGGCAEIVYVYMCVCVSMLSDGSYRPLSI